MGKRRCGAYNFIWRWDSSSSYLMLTFFYSLDHANHKNRTGEESMPLLQLPPFLPPPPDTTSTSTSISTQLTYDLRLLSMEGVYIQGPDGAVHDLYRGSPTGGLHVCVRVYRLPPIPTVSWQPHHLKSRTIPTPPPKTRPCASAMSWTPARAATCPWRPSSPSRGSHCTCRRVRLF